MSFSLQSPKGAIGDVKRHGAPHVSVNDNTSGLNNSRSHPPSQPTQYPSQDPILGDCRENSSDPHATRVPTTNNQSDSRSSRDLFASLDGPAPSSVPSASNQKTVSRRALFDGDTEYGTDSGNHSSSLEDPSHESLEVCSYSDGSPQSMRMDLEKEYAFLHQDRHAASRLRGNILDVIENNMEDMRSSLFDDEQNDALYDRLASVYDSVCDSESREDNDEISHVERAYRMNTAINDGLDRWRYAIPFKTFKIEVDTINSDLGRRFVIEGNSILRNIVREVRAIRENPGVIAATNLSRLDTLDVFLPEHLLEKLCAHINPVLTQRKQMPTSSFELKGMLILYLLAASYSSSVSTITATENHTFYYQLGISSKRYSEVWSALSCITERRQVIEMFGMGLSNCPNQAHDIIPEMENEVASINRVLLYIPDATIFSLDDDRQRLRSRAIAQIMLLGQFNRPVKGLGPVNNAVCSALLPIFFASHYSTPHEKGIRVWERLVHLLQGTPNTGTYMSMDDAVFASDKGYNDKTVIKFIDEKLGASEIGVLGQMLCAQVNNAAVVHRLSFAKRCGVLPDINQITASYGRGYREIRHAISAQGSFGDYARQLAKEYKKEMAKQNVKSVS